MRHPEHRVADFRDRALDGPVLVAVRPLALDGRPAPTSEWGPVSGFWLGHSDEASPPRTTARAVAMHPPRCRSCSTSGRRHRDDTSLRSAAPAASRKRTTPPLKTAAALGDTTLITPSKNRHSAHDYTLGLSRLWTLCNRRVGAAFGSAAWIGPAAETVLIG